MDRRFFIVVGLGALLLAGILWLRDRASVASARLQYKQREQPLPEALAEKNLRILHFYADKGSVSPGQSVLLCYGVANAEKVTLSPPVAELKPAYNRCLQIVPKETSTYTLTATDSAGRTESQSFRIEVTAPRIEPGLTAASPEEPRIDRFDIDFSKSALEEGLISLCYAVSGAETVEAPGVLPPTGALHGCFYAKLADAPQFTLKAYGKNGRLATKTLTVRAPVR